MSSLLHTSRLIHLQNTWAHARQHSPYYATRLPDGPTGRIDLNLLAEVPILTADELARYESDIRLNRSLPAYIFFTGGTSGTPQRVYGTEDDVGAAYARFEQRSSNGSNRPLTLITSGGAQGTLPVIPGRVGAISVPLRSSTGYEWAWRFLTEEHRFDGFEPRVSRLAIPLPAIKKLTHFVRERGYSPEALSLTSVCSYAAYLSTGWRRLIEATLRSPVIDCFGFTEIPQARAFREPGAEFFFFDDRVIWEAVDPWTNRPISRGLGRLVVTSLLPFASDRILFRYDPGDLVWVGPYDEDRQDAGFKFKGRIRHSWLCSRDAMPRAAVLAADIQEAIDVDPRVARFGNSRHAGVTHTEDDSFPKWRLSSRLDDGREVVVLEIELSFSPSLFTEESKAFERTLRDRLSSLSPLLPSDGSGEGPTLLVRCVAPGTVRDDEVRRC